MSRPLNEKEYDALLELIRLFSYLGVSLSIDDGDEKFLAAINRSFTQYANQYARLVKENKI